MTFQILCFKVNNNSQVTVAPWKFDFVNTLFSYILIIFTLLFLLLLFVNVLY